MLFRLITLLALQSSLAFASFPKTSNWDPQSAQRILTRIEQDARRWQVSESKGRPTTQEVQAFVESVQLMKLQVEQYPHSSTYTEYDLRRLLQAYQRTGVRDLKDQIEQLKRLYQ